ncbi:hypothetical protein EV426DRAFT_676678 [Tirmania nivea]|nr:hypothetical protein EV426DRAFT_676678 [Tirmania nivea]
MLSCSPWTQRKNKSHAIRVGPLLVEDCDNSSTTTPKDAGMSRRGDERGRFGGFWQLSLQWVTHPQAMARKSGDGVGRPGEPEPGVNAGTAAGKRGGSFEYKADMVENTARERTGKAQLVMKEDLGEMLRILAEAEGKMRVAVEAITPITQEHIVRAVRETLREELRTMRPEWTGMIQTVVQRLQQQHLRGDTPPAPAPLRIRPENVSMHVPVPVTVTQEWGLGLTKVLPSQNQGVSLLDQYQRLITMVPAVSVMPRSPEGEEGGTTGGSEQQKNSGEFSEGTAKTRTAERKVAVVKETLETAKTGKAGYNPTAPGTMGIHDVKRWPMEPSSASSSAIPSNAPESAQRPKVTPYTALVAAVTATRAPTSGPKVWREAKAAAKGKGKERAAPKAPTPKGPEALREGRMRGEFQYHHH